MPPNDAIKLLTYTFRVFSDASVEVSAMFYDELATLIEIGTLEESEISYADSKLDWLHTAITDIFEDEYVQNLPDCENLGQACFDLNGTPPEGDILCISFVKMENSQSSIQALCPLLRLLSRVVYRKTNSLEEIDAVLGAPVLLPDVDYDRFHILNTEEQKEVLDSMFYCVNFFRELVNGFSVNNDYLEQLLQRLENIVQLQENLAKYLPLVRDYVPPQCQFYQTAKVNLAVKSKPKGKAKGAKKKTSKKKVDLNDSSVDVSTSNKTAVDKVMPASSALVDLSPYDGFLRDFELRVFVVVKQPLKLGSDNEDPSTNISTKVLQFLLTDNLNKLNGFFAKKSPFGRESNKPKFNTMVPKTAEEVADTSTKILPALRSQLDVTGQYCKNLIEKSDGVLDALDMFQQGSMEVKQCHTLILQNILAIVSWPGFHNQRHKSMLKNLLKGLNTRSPKKAPSTQFEAFRYFLQQHAHILHITAAATLVKLVRSLLSFLPEVSARNTAAVHKLCSEFLSRSWTDLKGAPEQGAAYNRQVEALLSEYMGTLPADGRIESVSELIKKVETESENMEKKEDMLPSFPTVTKGNFEVIYRVMFESLVDVSKQGNKLEEWQILVEAYESLTNILKRENFQQRPIKLTFAKYTSQYIRIFLSKGFPIIEMELRTNQNEVNGLLKTLQGCTRFAQNLIYDGKKLKDSTLVKYAPMLRLQFEKIIMCVKAALTGEKCLNAFFCGQLRNKNLHGEDIYSQETNEDGEEEGSAAGSDNDENEEDDVTVMSDESDKESSRSLTF